LVEPLEYEVQPWTARGLALMVHHLTVTTEFQRRGVAGGLLAFAEARARERGLASLRSDTSELNPGMKAAFVRQGWVRVGPLRFSDATVEFGAWEKLVGRTAD
jgi:GNAT superfamily N-acetyltransferase